jgi:hypothetical protein
VNRWHVAVERQKAPARASSNAVLVV